MSKSKRYQDIRIRHRKTKAETLRRSYILRFTDSLATTTLAFALPLMVYGITHNIAWSGASFMFEWLPRLTAIPVSGPVVDRIGAARFFVVADSVRCFMLLAAAGYLTIHPKAWVFIVLTAIATGMVAEATFVAAEKMGIEVTGTEPLHKIQAVQVGIDQTVQVLGPVVGGVMLTMGNTAVLTAAALLAGVSVLLAQKLDVVTTTIEKDVIHLLKSFRVGLAVIRKERTLVHVVAGTAFFNLLLALLLTITPAVIEQRFHQQTSGVSTAWSLAAIASVVAVGLASRAARRYNIGVIGFVSAMFACLACGYAGVTHAYWAYVGTLMLFLAMDASYAVYIRTARARLVPKEVYGTTVGIIVLLSLIPYPIAGALVAVVPFSHLSYLVLGSVLCTALLSLWSFLAMDRRIFAQDIATNE